MKFVLLLTGVVAVGDALGAAQARIRPDCAFGMLANPCSPMCGTKECASVTAAHLQVEGCATAMPPGETAGSGPSGPFAIVQFPSLRTNAKIQSPAISVYSLKANDETQMSGI